MEISPSDHSDILIPEPLGDESGDVGWVHIADLFGSFGPGHESVQIGRLEGVLLGDGEGVVVLEQFVPVFGAGSEDFHLRDLV